MKPGENMHRREFLRRAAWAGASVCAAGAGAFLLHDTEAPPAEPEPKDQVRLKNFSVPEVSGKTISIVQSGSRAAALDRAVQLLGGMERFIDRGDRVVIKPNIAFASPPALGATSSPDLVAYLIHLCRKAGAAKITVLDNPINDPASCYQLSGIEEAARSSSAELVLPRPNLFGPATLSGGSLIRNWPLFYRPLADADKLIGVAPVKSHHRSGASLTMKNWYGLLGGRRNIFHQDINTIITELAALVTPTLVILDGFDVMISNGPTGGSLSDLVQKNTLIASCDQVAADAYGCSLLGMEPEDLPFITMAEKMNAGTADYRSLKPLTETL